MRVLLRVPQYRIRCMHIQINVYMLLNGLLCQIEKRKRHNATIQFKPYVGFKCESTSPGKIANGHPEGLQIRANNAVHTRNFYTLNYKHRGMDAEDFNKTQ